jgi:hypothetical protein
MLKTDKQREPRAPGVLADNLGNLFKQAAFSRQQFRIADGILEGTQRWVAELASTLEDLESMSHKPQDTTVRAARLDTEKLAEQLGVLRSVLRNAMGEDPHATVH